jgi:hypothetical protein
MQMRTCDGPHHSGAAHKYAGVASVWHHVCARCFHSWGLGRPVAPATRRFNNVILGCTQVVFVSGVSQCPEPGSNIGLPDMPANTQRVSNNKGTAEQQHWNQRSF